MQQNNMIKHFLDLNFKSARGAYYTEYGMPAYGLMYGWTNRQTL